MEFEHKVRQRRKTLNRDREETKEGEKRAEVDE